MRRLIALGVLSAALIAPLALAGCAGRSCPPDQASSALSNLRDVTNGLADTVTRIEAANSPDELGPLLDTLSTLKTKAQGIDAPDCLKDAKVELTAAIDSGAKAADALKNGSVEDGQNYLDQANQHLDTLNRLLDEFSQK